MPVRPSASSTRPHHATRHYGRRLTSSFDDDSDRAAGTVVWSSGSVPTAGIATSVALRTPRSSRTMTPLLSCLIATEQCGGGWPLVTTRSGAATWLGATAGVCDAARPE
jgi:hypothetical protein